MKIAWRCFITSYSSEWEQFIREYRQTQNKVEVAPELTRSKEILLKNGTQLTLHPESEEDCREVENLTREAFWRTDRLEKLGGIGCDEHYLAHTLRTSPEFVPELDVVAEAGGKLVGNVMFSMGYVRTDKGTLHPVLNFGPLSVLPEYQRTGVGSAIMRHTLKTAARMGYGAVLFFGHPTYYPRFGFREAREFGITTAQGTSHPAFMAMELIYGSLDGIVGTYHESPLYNVDPAKAREFDESFPKRR